MLQAHGGRRWSPGRRLLSVLCAGASRIAEPEGSVSRGQTSLDRHPRSATQQWLQHARPGYCRFTEATNSCEGESGSFSLDACAASTWKLAVATCLRHCRSCARCTSISVSRSARDCSWFSSAVDCTKQLRTDVAGFRSGPVPHISELEEARNDSLICQLVRSPGLFRDSERFNRLMDFNYSETRPCPVSPVLRDDKSRLVQEPPLQEPPLEWQPNKRAGHGRTRRTTTSRVAFITVMLGLYELSLKEPVEQLHLTPPPDFLAFCDIDFAAHALRRDADELRQDARTVARPNGSAWMLDWTPYHITHAANRTGEGERRQRGGIGGHQKFAAGKWFKMQFYRIPRLQRYRWVVWMDGTIELLGANCASFIASAGYALIGLNFAPRRCSLRLELEPTLLGGKYDDQPVLEQLVRYARAGMPEVYGMWLTSLIVFDLGHAHTRAWLDTWYAETQEWSSQDQLSFPYVAWTFRERLPVSSFVPERLDPERGDSMGCYYGFPCAFDKRWHGEGVHQDKGEDCSWARNDW